MLLCVICQWGNLCFRERYSPGSEYTVGGRKYLPYRLIWRLFLTEPVPDVASALRGRIVVHQLQLVHHGVSDSLGLKLHDAAMRLLFLEVARQRVAEQDLP